MYQNQTRPKNLLIVVFQEFLFFTLFTKKKKNQYLFAFVQSYNAKRKILKTNILQVIFLVKNKFLFLSDIFLS